MSENITSGVWRGPVLRHNSAEQTKVFLRKYYKKEEEKNLGFLFGITDCLVFSQTVTEESFVGFFITEKSLPS